MIKLIAFDLDGTIGDTVPMCIRAFEKAVSPYAGHILSEREISQTFGLNEGGMIKKDDLLNADSLSIEIPSNYLKEKIDFKITSFLVSVALSGFIDDYPQNSGSTFTPEQKAMFAKLNPGQKLYIESIKAKDNLGMTRCLPSLVFKIAE